jgi:hypothetical protein
MTLGDLLAKVRVLLSEPSTVRWTNQYLIGLINDAQNAVAYEVDFPEASEHYGTVNGQTEYQLVDLVKVLRVYVTNGISQQPLIGTDITLLEGRTRDIFDQSSGIRSNGPAMTPQWLAQQPSSYPIIGGWHGQGLPAPVNSMWHNIFGAHGAQRQRPEYYLRGGYLGLVPPPDATAAYDINGKLISGFEIVVDHIPVPFTMSISADLSAFPARFKDAICFRVVADCLFSDKNSDYQAAEAKFASECVKLRKWKESLQADKSKTYMITTMRTWFRRRRTGWN